MDYIRKLATVNQGAAMRSAVETGCVGIAQELLSGGFAANAIVDVSAGTTALHHAASNGRIDIAAILIQNGADVDAKDHNWHTPLRWAANRPDVMRFLLSRGADVNARSNYGCTVLQAAVAFGSVEGCRLLIEAGAEINVASQDGETPLAAALVATDEDIEKVRLLIAAGAKTSFVPDRAVSDYLTPFQQALVNLRANLAHAMFEFGGEDPYQLTLDGRTMDFLVLGSELMEEMLRVMRTEFAVKLAMAPDSFEIQSAGRKRSTGLAL